jgi:hypothetical protein
MKNSCNLLVLNLKKQTTWESILSATSPTDIFICSPCRSNSPFQRELCSVTNLVTILSLISLYFIRQLFHINLMCNVNFKNFQGKVTCEGGEFVLPYQNSVQRITFMLRHISFLT